MALREYGVALRHRTGHCSHVSEVKVGPHVSQTGFAYTLAVDNLRDTNMCT